jgi:hypothetical protein
MEEISDIVKSIVRGCAQAGVDAPDVLAAFIARTVIIVREFINLHSI